PSMSLANATLQEVYTLSLHDALPILLKQLKLYVVNKDSDANSITYYASGSRKLINRAARLIEEAYPAAEVAVHNVAIVSAIGSALKVQGILAQTVAALAEAGVRIQAFHQSIRQVEMQCVVNEEDYDKAIAARHRALIEPENHGDVIAAAEAPRPSCNATAGRDLLARRFAC